MHLSGMSVEFVFFLICTIGFHISYGDVDLLHAKNNILIDVISEDEVRSIVKEDQHTVLLFTNSSSHESQKAEDELLKIKNELLINLHVNILKIESSSYLAKENGIEKLPALLFYRKGQPALYDGLIQEDELYEWLQQNLQSYVHQLDDQSFEHLTQAATGATTGDWFVLFCNVSNLACHSLQSVWESVAIRCKGRLNIAVVDTQNTPELNERFKIKESPTFKFFHHGKMYDYSVNKFDISSLTKFALGWFKNMKHDKVPGQKTPFDYLVDKIAKKIQTELKDPYVVPSIVMLLLPFSIVIAAVFALGRDYKVKPE